MIDPNQFDKLKFTNEAYAKRVEKPWGYEIHWVPEGKPYMGKILHIDAGKRISLQIHDKKEESWLLINGQAKVICNNTQGEMVEIELEKEKGFNCQIGQRHRLMAITDCDIVEASTPEIGTTYRLDDDYKRPDETEELRKQDNRGWNPNQK